MPDAPTPEVLIFSTAVGSVNVLTVRLLARTARTMHAPPLGV